MADRKISDLTALTTPASGDYLPIVDISEAAAASKNKRITIEELFRGVPLGTAAAPSIAIEGNENTGVFSPGANQLAIATNGTGRLFVNSTGLVGIGTSSPNANYKVTIEGNSAAVGPAIAFSDTAASPNNYNIGINGSKNFFIDGPSAASFDFVLDSSGRVGIGSSTPLSNFVVSNSGAEGIELVVNQPDGANTVQYFNYNRSSATYQNVAYLAASHQWRIGNDEKARIDTSGRLLIGQSTANANGGILQLTSGITFPATAVAASDVNTLDDYEEGTWTPTAFGETTAGTTTYTFQLGQYVKVGNMVTCTAGIGVSNLTGTGKLLLGNLPFTLSNTTMDVYSPSIGKVDSLTFSNQLGLMALAGTTSIRVISISSNSAYAQVDVDSAFEFYYTVTFFV